MAKLGEGDSRWIVNDRDDGRNCNDWHWTERNLEEWATSSIKKRLEDKEVFRDGDVVVRTTTMSQFNGECSVMNRKRKVICHFDVNYELSWEGKVLDSDGEAIYTAKGKFSVPDADDSTVGDSLQVDVSCAETGASAEKLLGVARKQGRAFVRAGMIEFQTDLKESHGVSNKGSMRVVDSASPTPVTPVAEEPKKEEKKPAAAAENSDVGDFSLKLEWRAPVSELWDTLTNPGKVAAFTRSQCQYDAVEGGSFSLLGGGMAGTFTTVDASSDPRVLAMKWRLDTWQQGHFSDVRIEMTSEDAGSTVMTFKQTNVPYFELDRTKEGWKRNFWEPIKIIFGFGYDKRK
eukprot:TRINITY_DN1865_c6_g1_i1.p1 TRINITY_DN1865_c6_g1~~TRINITY_DN1865_c6_g1_i1.p1  ORF type:complete len:346 (+),score=122.95 TRINITY_DN1865_c6_g1_i1:83-1120(+)